MTNGTLTSFPILKTDRLTLRQLAISDEKEIFELRSNDDVNRYLDRKASESIEEARTFIQTIIEGIKNNKFFYWAITSTKDDKLVGIICLFNFSNDRYKAEIGYELLPDFQGKGIMQEATKKVIEFSFQNLQLSSIEAHTHFENQSSANLLKKFNFQEQTITGNNTNENFIIFKLTKTAWQKTLSS